jgi:hypothetical protein
MILCDGNLMDHRAPRALERHNRIELTLLIRAQVGESAGFRVVCN